MCQYDYPRIFDGLQECCEERTCISDFQHLPERLLNRDLCAPKPLLCDKERWCKRCGLPSRDTPNVRDTLEDAADDLANVLYENNFKALFPGNTKNVTVQFKVSQRMFQRVGRHSSCRRNVLNLSVQLPFNNCYVNHHQTYRYAPQFIGIEQLLKRILREAVGLFEEAIDEDYPEFYCSC